VLKAVVEDSVLLKLVSPEIVKALVLDIEFAVSPAKLLDLAFLSDDAYTAYLHSSRGDIDFEIQTWKNPPTSTADLPLNSRIKRKLTYTHPLKCSIPFMPKTCICHETQRLYTITQNHYVLDVQIKIKGVMFCDNFTGHL
jgi:hypothetical protein